jgi:uncharacterized membrane protein YkoI
MLALALGVVAWQLARERHEFQELREEISPRTDNNREHGRGILTLQEIIRHMELPEDARILEVERERKNGKIYYEIELLMPGGIVEERLIDPYTGEIVERQYEREEKASHAPAAGRR